MRSAIETISGGSDFVIAQVRLLPLDRKRFIAVKDGYTWLEAQECHKIGIYLLVFEISIQSIVWIDRIGHLSHEICTKSNTK